MASIDSALEPILARYGRDPSALLQILRDAQEACDWISPTVRAEVAHALDIPATQIDCLTRFYAHLYDEPRGKYRVLFSDNITDRMADAPALMARMLDQFGLEPGEVSSDGLLSIAMTSCTGMCDQGPALLVNNRAVTRMTPERVDAISALIRARAPLDDWPPHFFEVTDNIRRADILLGATCASGEAIRAAIWRAGATACSRR